MVTTIYCQILKMVTSSFSFHFRALLLTYEKANNSYNFNCSDSKSIVFDSIFLGSEKSLLFYGNSSDILDTLHHFYSLLYKGNLYTNTRPVDNPIVILYEYKGVKYSLLVKDITSLPTWGEYKMGIR